MRAWPKQTLLFYLRMLYYAQTPFRADAGPEGRGMTNRKILIVDDDSELREALVEQLALHEEFESIAVDNGNQGSTGRQGRAD